MRRRRVLIDPSPAPRSRSSGPNGRDSAGRFAPGNRAAVGRGRHAWKASLLDAIEQEVTQEVFARIVRGIARKAMQGDVPAATWIAAHSIGKPQTRIEITAADDDYEADMRFL